LLVGLLTGRVYLEGFIYQSHEYVTGGNMRSNLI